MKRRKASQTMRHVGLVKFLQRSHLPKLALPATVFRSRGLHFDDSRVIPDQHANVSVPDRVRQVAENTGASAV